MAIDHPDGIRAISVSRADIKAPVDIQKQTINVEIDIVAQTLAKIQINIASSSITLNINIAAAAAGVTLNVNLKSQTANINVNIAASAATVNVNISSQTANINVNIAASVATITVSVTGTAQVNIYAQSIGMYLKPDWEAKENHDKGFHIANTSIAYGESSYVSYTVTAGKTLYLTHMGFSIVAAASADYDHHLVGECYIYNHTASKLLARVGGNGGNSSSFPQPIVIDAGEEFQGSIGSYAGVTCRMSAAFWGYEI